MRPAAACTGIRFSTITTTVPRIRIAAAPEATTPPFPGSDPLANNDPTKNVTPTEKATGFLLLAASASLLIALFVAFLLLFAR